jgi:hypothetical protein
MSSDLEHAGTEEVPETDDSRLKRFDKRIEEWLTSLKDEANERSPEVLSAMAAKAKDVAQYLERMAEQARARRMPEASPDVRPPSVGPGSGADPQGQDAEELGT